MTEEPNIRPLPHSVGCEKSVLSCLMKYPDLLQECHLDAEIFYFPAHRKLYGEMRKVGDVELVSFIDRLVQSGQIEELGGPAAISEIYTYAPHEANFQRHLEILRDRHARRMAIAACAKAAEAAFEVSDDDDATNYLDALSGPITAIFDYATGTAEEEDPKALAREFLADFEARVAGKVSAMGIPTGIREADELLMGLHKGHMGIISGRSGGGKSTLATQVAAHLAHLEIPTLYLAYERGRMSVFQRMIIQAAPVAAGIVNDPRANKPTVRDLTLIRDAVTRASQCLHVRTPRNRKAATCLAEIRRYVRKHGVQVAIVDQIGLLRGDRHKGQSAEEELRLISNSIQELAQELAITIIVLSQESVEGETKNARAIEEDADWWLSIVQERNKKAEDFGQHKHILIAKDSHHGKAGERLPLVLCKETLRFVYGEREEKPKPSGFHSRFQDY